MWSCSSGGLQPVRCADQSARAVTSRHFPCRELLRCEAALARLYCRLALLSIFAPKLPHLFTRLFHIPAIRDITLEHLQLLSNQLLAPPLPGNLGFASGTANGSTRE